MAVKKITNRSPCVIETQRTILQLIDAKKIPNHVAIQMLSYAIVKLSYRFDVDPIVEITE